MKIEWFIPFIDLGVKFFLYVTVLKLRKLEAPIMTCFLCAGASILAGYLPFPPMLHLTLTFVAAGYFIVQNTGASVFPDGIGIPIAVEVSAALVMRFVVGPIVDAM